MLSRPCTHTHTHTLQHIHLFSFAEDAVASLVVSVCLSCQVTADELAARLQELHEREHPKQPPSEEQRRWATAAATRRLC